MDFGTALKRIRNKKGLTQEAAALLIGIRQGALSKLEQVGREPDMSTIKKIALGYDIPMEVIVFMAMEEKDIPDNRKWFYNSLAQLVKEIIDDAVFLRPSYPENVDKLQYFIPFKVRAKLKASCLREDGKWHVTINGMDTAAKTQLVECEGETVELARSVFTVRDEIEEFYN